MTPDVDVVVPTVGRPSLGVLLNALGEADGPLPRRVILVDDRRDPRSPLPTGRLPSPLDSRLRVLPGRGAGPAAARNLGWRAASAPWVSFLDDDVVPDTDWPAKLAADLGELEAGVAASQGRIRVPLPPGRPPTDWERNVQGLEVARWATADMAYRRSVLHGMGGFDERFPRAYREDADLGLRVTRAGYRIVRGHRCVSHPVRPADRWVSVRLQAGNADDALMLLLHGPGWRKPAGVSGGRRPGHLAIAGSALVSLFGLLRGNRPLAGLGAAGWLAGTAELAWTRIAPGPRSGEEVTTMLATSAMIPAAAAFHWAAGLIRAVGLVGRSRNLEREPRPGDAAYGAPPELVLFDRDGTLVVDVPYNGDPDRVVPVPGARRALDRLRGAGVAVGVVSNQSGVARGLISMEQVEAVNRRVAAELGEFAVWSVCPHGPQDGCGCRKPAPGLVLRAARAVGVAPSRCAVVGDTGGDVQAGHAAGARTVLVPTAETRPAEVHAAAEVAADIEAAVDRLLDGSGA